MGTGVCLCVLPWLLLAGKNDPSKKGRHRGALKTDVSKGQEANEQPCTSYFDRALILSSGSVLRV